MESNSVSQKSSKAIVAIILGAIGLLGGVLSPLIGYILSIIVIVMSVRKKAYKENKKFIISLVLGIIALIVSLVSHIAGIILLLNI